MTPPTPVEMTTKRASARWRGAPQGSHEWVSFPDPDEERTWMFDVTFLESSWTCIFGRGCQGVLTGPAPELEHGCCSYGAHFTGKKDVRRVEAAAATLTPEQWQLFKKGYRDGKIKITKRNAAGDITTRLVDDACIFLNRPGFPGGAGCALHRAAIERGLPHLELKPDVCWQLPIRREDEVADDGHVTSIVRQWDRRDWGEGGAEFHWWCTESADAFVGNTPVYVELRHELIAMVGEATYRRVARYLKARGVTANRSGPAADPTVAVALPHPAVRRPRGR